MRWRTIEEVKAGKGEKICANVNCGRTEDLEGIEGVFGYMEEGKWHDVLVKCILCEKCGKKVRRARGTEEKRHKRSHDKISKEKAPEGSESTSTPEQKKRDRSESHKRRRSHERRRQISRRNHSPERGVQTTHSTVSQDQHHVQ
jgi:protein FRA10AC1